MTPSDKGASFVQPDPASPPTPSVHPAPPASPPYTPDLLRELVLSALCQRLQAEVVPANLLMAAIGFLKQFPPNEEPAKAEAISDTLRQYQGRMPFAKAS